MKEAARTEASKFAPWATTRQRSHRSVAHRTTGVSMFWRDGRLSRVYIATVCRKLLPDGRLHEDKPDLPVCQGCSEG